MQAIILAAGMGRRLGHYTDGNTKCMVSVAGRTLIERMLDSLVLHELSRIILVIGYKGENLKKYVGESWKGVEILYVENPLYDKTNNIYSLYLAKDFLSQEDTVLLESDLIFTDSVLSRIVDDPRESLVMVSGFQSWMDGTMVKLGENDTIHEFISGKKLIFSDSEHYYKTVNIYKFSAGFSQKRYIPFLEAYIKSVGQNEYYEQVLTVVNFLDRSDLPACVLDDSDMWYEIDDKHDLDNAETLFAGEEEKLQRMQNRYGGYWRYPGLIDFCYLVNPYFPGKNLLDELRNNFDILLSEYPSGEDAQNLLASKLFEIHRGYILTGNGAAELINVMMREEGIITGFITPTFNEYPNRVSPESIRYYHPENSDFRYGIKELKEFSADIDRLVLINPDNPSGNFIPKEDVIELASSLGVMGVQLVLDESFVDFSIGGEENTLIHDDILESFPNLVVVKSISKSYGVPGLRLGIMASSDRDFLQDIRKGLSIWNINSFAEFFLQIIGKYKAEYAEACGKIARERSRFFELLSELTAVRPLESQANYITCELTGGLSAHILTRRLLNQENLFVKDLSGKTGIPGDRQYIRVAVRSSEDNDKLIAALKRESENVI